MVVDAISSVTLMTSWCILIAAILPQGGISLKMARVSVPRYTLRGESVELLCEFDLQGDKLYSVSWYKDHDEFYRFVPSGKQTQHIYKIDGIKVDPRNSDAQKVVVRNVPLKASGDYRCEVSAEAPHFSSAHGEGRMDVVALPSDGPEIIGEQRSYVVGEEVSFNCTSPKSFPAARLTWFVNDQLVTSEFELAVQQQSLFTSLAGLRFVLGPEHFLGGRLKVRCVATITGAPTSATTVPTPSPVLHSPEHHRHSASTPQHSSIGYNREALLLVKGCSSPLRPVLAPLLVAVLTVYHL